MLGKAVSKDSLVRCTRCTTIHKVGNLLRTEGRLLKPIEGYAGRRFIFFSCSCKPCTTLVTEDPDEKLEISSSHAELVLPPDESRP
jgi:hypothetical protein